mmetsp:Transcript_10377/g.27194  ORF Transcript_10377/g.27194 Transcript_10377/m.27194 type:complete len:118 (-) Transcript_10377:198-551(-)
MLLKIHQKSYESKVLFQASEALKIWGDDLIEGIEAMLKVLQARDPRWACLAEFERSGSQAKKRTCQSAFRLLPHLMQVKYEGFALCCHQHNLTLLKHLGTCATATHGSSIFASKTLR